jgi:secreted trypsin-like serine protease
MVSCLKDFDELFSIHIYRTEQFGERIIGGEEAYRGQFPWQAEIETLVNNVSTSYCGGALISRDYIITAASCIPEY